MREYPKPPFQKQSQTPPGFQQEMSPLPDCGEESYEGSGRLLNKVALITGADSGIGRAVAIAFAREGADVAISYLDEHEDARETSRWVEQSGRRCLLLPGDLGDRTLCSDIVEKTVAQFGRLDILVNNAAFQRFHNSLDEITDEVWLETVNININALFRVTKAAEKHMTAGGSIINTTSVNSDTPWPNLLAYATTKGAIANFSAGLAQMLAPKGIRVNSVAPGPIWTPLIVATLPESEQETFGHQVPMGRPGQPVEVAPVYVLLASDEASYISGTRYGVTGGQPIL